jgi:hypothetical protein
MRSWLNLIKNTKYLGRIGNDGVNKFIDLKFKRVIIFENTKENVKSFKIGLIVLLLAFVK